MKIKWIDVCFENETALVVGSDDQVFRWSRNTGWSAEFRRIAPSDVAELVQAIKDLGPEYWSITQSLGVEEPLPEIEFRVNPAGELIVECDGGRTRALNTAYPSQQALWQHLKADPAGTVARMVAAMEGEK